MKEEKGSKLRDIKETASDAVEIIRELGTPDVQETLGTLKEITTIAKDIIQTLQSPEWQRNMENIRLISQNFNQVSERMDRTTRELKETGIIEEAKGLISTAKGKMEESFGGGDVDGKRGGSISGRDIKELAGAFKETAESVKALIDELKLTVKQSKAGGGTLGNIQQTAREASELYHTVADEAKGKQQ